jgi:K+ potassium transporter
MTEALQAADAARHGVPRIPLPAALAALGIVYGDIGTSPLYAFTLSARCQRGCRMLVLLADRRGRRYGEPRAQFVVAAIFLGLGWFFGRGC